MVPKVVQCNGEFVFNCCYSTISLAYSIVPIITINWNGSSVSSLTFQDLLGITDTVYLASTIPKVAPTGVSGQYYAGPLYGKGKAVWGVMYDETSIHRAFQRPALFINIRNNDMCCYANAIWRIKKALFRRVLFF